ncbi:hypothetical protein AVEN_235713-1 [Araneus ventricosus]|uniref:Uncharacterized protein n=1 Tax=Araneus ventricosus TaxID=182803 RepID=A0A4Y2Q8P5_ARAVE|nr:hypothetical protein AVEN_235713-1 [Araneus ventricosus]
MAGEGNKRKNLIKSHYPQDDADSDVDSSTASPPRTRQSSSIQTNSEVSQFTHWHLESTNSSSRQDPRHNLNSTYCKRDVITAVSTLDTPLIDKIPTFYLRSWNNLGYYVSPKQKHPNLHFAHDIQMCNCNKRPLDLLHI